MRLRELLVMLLLAAACSGSGAVDGGTGGGGGGAGGAGGGGEEVCFDAGANGPECPGYEGICHNGLKVSGCTLGTECHYLINPCFWNALLRCEAVDAGTQWRCYQ